MPYIKYRGGRSPRNPKNQASYEDHRAPCYQGLEKLVADAWRLAEEKHQDPTQQSAAAEAFIVERGYPGLAHVGGVCLVEGDEMRETDEVISEEEYLRLRDQITAENAESRARREMEALQNNDPFRRASPEHERMGWRTRVLISSFTELDYHAPFPIHDTGYAYLRVRKYLPNGVTLQLIDLYHGAEGNIEQAIFDGTDLAEMLVDLLSVAGYGAAHVERVISTTIPICKPQQEFFLAISWASRFNTPIPVDPGYFETASISDHHSRVILRHVRDGLSSADPSVAYVAFWNAIERQALELAKKNNFKRGKKGKTTSSGREGDWDKKRGTEILFQEAGFDPSRLAKHRDMRNRIQHGEPVRSSSFLKEVFEQTSEIKTVALVTAATALGVRFGTHVYLPVERPVTVYSCRMRENGVPEDVRPRVVEAPSSIGKLPQRVCGDARRTIQIGIDYDQNLDPLAYPPVS